MRLWASVFVALLCMSQSATAIEVVAHRGSRDEAPENTFAAARRCIELGVDYLDTDVQMSKDGVFYVFHDLSLPRTTNGTGMLMSKTSAELDQLDAGIKFGPQFAGERIPRLEDYLKLAKGKAKIYIDFKNGDLPKLVALIKELGFEKDVFFWFFNPNMALQFRELAPDWPLKVNAGTPEAVADAVATYRATIIECNVSQLTPALRDTCQKLGVKIMIKATHDTEEEYRAIIAATPDYANVDFPKVFKALLEKH
jgi:glycerophosphoryl diester phosphodiesterase